MKRNFKRVFCIIFTAVLLAGILLQTPVEAKEAVSCKSLCSAALEGSGAAGKLEYQSGNAIDFGALSVSARKKVKSIQYICDSKEVYSLCVIQAKNAAGAKSLYKQLRKYKKNNCSSAYLSDYSSTEQKVYKNALCGRKGRYVWYIALSHQKAVNTKGQDAIKKKL